MFRAHHSSASLWGVWLALALWFVCAVSTLTQLGAMGRWFPPGARPGQQVAPRPAEPALVAR